MDWQPLINSIIGALCALFLIRIFIIVFAIIRYYWNIRLYTKIQKRMKQQHLELIEKGGFLHEWVTIQTPISKKTYNACQKTGYIPKLNIYMPTSIIEQLKVDEKTETVQKEN